VRSWPVSNLQHCHLLFDSQGKTTLKKYHFLRGEAAVSLSLFLFGIGRLEARWFRAKDNSLPTHILQVIYRHFLQISPCQ
jgi:hypothetical protein